MIETDDPDILLLLGQDALEQGDLLHRRRAAEGGNPFAAVRAGLVLEADDPAAAAALFRALPARWCSVSRAQSDALVLARSRLQHPAARHPGLRPAPWPRRLSAAATAPSPPAGSGWCPRRSA